MLRQAAAKHAHAEAGRTSDRDNSQPTVVTSRLNAGSSILGVNKSAGNAVPNPPVPRPISKAVKRTSSGLAKAISKSKGFDENTPALTAQSVSQHAFFDENDFDSDIDLEIEDLGSKQRYAPSVRSTNTPAPAATVSAEATAHQQRNESVSRDSGLGDSIPHSSSDTEIPWSSSPAAHHGPPLRSLSRFAYAKPDNKPTPEVRQPLPPPAKRRTLPWAKKDTETAPTITIAAHVRAQDEVQQHRPQPAATTAIHATPAPANHVRQLPWEKTSSAIKEQQKGLRELNKAKVKTSKVVPDALAQLGQKPKDKVAPVFLSSEQQHVCDLVLNKHQSVFFTGSAGTGKSVLLREIIARLRVKNSKEPDRVAVTASTGLAACNIGGVTLHSFAGFGLGKEEVPELVKKIKRNGKAKQRWLRTKVLIIDEISMVDADLFDKLEAIARNMRRNARPFGGIQLVITGDFFQLPPVPENNRVARFAFDAETWKASVVNTIGLHQVFRQKDPVFANMLNEMREGRLTPSSIQAFAKLSRPLDSEGDLAATELFPTRQEVERANSGRMSKLAGNQQTFDARDGGSTDAATRERLLSNCMAPKTLVLKKGSQVMLIKNIDETLVNGSVGKVIAFQTPSMYDRYQNGVSAPDDKAEAGALADQALGESKIQKAAARLSANIIGSSAEMFPLVRFVSENGVTRDLLCEREAWKVELPNGEVQASRSQIPLILAWALSIHKAQGQTLERVKVDLGKVFEKGQAYVALSRATTIAGLQVLRFDAKKVMAHERVRQFYSNLSRVESGQTVDVRETGGDEKKDVKPIARAPMARDYETKMLNGEL